MTAQPADRIPASGPDTGPYEVIHLGGQAAVVVRDPAVMRDCLVCAGCASESTYPGILCTGRGQMTLGLPGCGGPKMIILRVELDQVLLASHRGRPAPRTP